MEKRLRKGQFTFDDFLRAYKMLRRMGPLGGILKLIPGMKEQLGEVDVDEQQLKRVEAIVLSMTPHERSTPHVIDGKRRLADRTGLRRAGRAGEPAARGAQADGEHDEADGEGQAARTRRRRAGARTVGAPRRGRHHPSARNGRVDGGKGDTWQSSCGSRAWARRRTRSTGSSRPTHGRRATGSSSRSSGRYNPQTDPSTIDLDEAKVKDWLGKGAQPTEAVARLIKIQGIER